MISPAVVTEVIQARHGVLVAFRDGVYFPKEGERFVRVLASRAHSSGGAEIRLPQVGELGLVVEVDENLSVWLGSLPWQDANQVDGEPFLDSFRHESAVHRHLHRNGDLQLDHPSGVCIRIVEKGGDGAGSPLPAPHGSNVPEVTVTPAPWVVVDHPGGAKIQISPGGHVTLSAPMIDLVGAVKTTGPQKAKTATSGSFTTPTGQAVLVQDGLISSLGTAADILNTDYFDGLIDAVDSVNSCEDLQTLLDDAADSLGGIKAGIAEQLAKVTPMVDLVIAPAANPAAIVSWITNYITYLVQPVVAPYVTYPLQLALLTTKVAELTSAFDRAKSRIPNCQATMPTI